MVSTESGLTIGNFGCVRAVKGGISVKILAGSLLLILAYLEGTAALAASLLGSGLGVDHVGVVVRDLDVAKSDFERLGFTVSSGGSFPGGLSNKIIHFDNGTYLELLAVRTSEQPSSDVADVAGFAQKHEGAMFLGLEVSSAEESAAYLRAHNFDVKDPQPGNITQEGDTDKPKVPLWYTVELNDKPAPGKQVFSLPIFFIQYTVDLPTSAKAKERAIHANAAAAIRSVWMVVSNLPAKMKMLNDAGFEPSTAPEVKVFGAQGRAYKAGAGQLVLLDATDKSPVVREYVAKFGEGIMGISIQVLDIQKARSAVESASDARLTKRGSRDLLLPPAMTHGLWIEMTERSQLQ